MGELQVVGSAEELPPALDGVVPIEVYREMMKTLIERASNYRGGMIQIALALFQACLFLVIMLGFFLSRYLNGISFFNPITLVVLGTMEFAVLSVSGRFFQREELKLKKELLDLVHPWRQEYGIIAKMRKFRGQIREEQVGKRSNTLYYCLVLEKRGPTDDIDTVSPSSLTDTESAIESEVESEV